MTNTRHQTDFDAIVVGAGFTGIYTLHKLKNDLGLRVRAFETGSEVGGTWHWNRYPGAHTDSYWFTYCYTFDDDLMQDWDWADRYSKREQVQAYLKHVVDRFDLGNDIQLNTEVVSAHFDESRAVWVISTATGETYTSRYFVTGIGVLNVPVYPDIPGANTYRGKAVHTSAWPEDVQIAGKRVGVIGNGASGSQLIVAVAPQAEHLTVFMRSPQYVLPAVDRKLSDIEKATVKDNYQQIVTGLWNSNSAFGYESSKSGKAASEAERRRVFQKAWDFGGPFNFLVGTFSDLIVDAEVNESAAAFIREKIKEIVKDPETARILTPTEPYARRPICGHGFYETFNRDNVRLVDVKANPIAEITPKGLRTVDGEEHELDVLVFATGFDGITGSFRNIDIRGRGGKSLGQEHWSFEAGRDGSTYLGVAVADFPNMFTAFGPHGPFANNPWSIQAQVEFIAELIGHAERQEARTIEATRDAEDSWVKSSNAAVAGTLLLSVDSWLTGGNVPGKPKQVLLHLAGLAEYRKKVTEVAEHNFEGFLLEPAEVSPSAGI